MAGLFDDEDFDLEGTIGQGAFGTVYLVCDKADRSQKYALKVVDLSRASRIDKQAAVKEASILSKLNHDNIIQHIDSFMKGGALCILTEYCDGGNLLRYLEIRGRRGKLEEARIVTWFKQICSGLEYMHKNLLMHRDVKTENVFLTGPDLTAKLGDLGLAKVMESPTALALTFCGSPYYMSPEIFLQRPYDQKTDIWALGVIIYELSTLDKPFDATLMYTLVNKIVNGQLPALPEEDYSPALLCLIRRMLSKKSRDRPTASEILKDTLFKPRRPLPLPPKMQSIAAKNNETLLMSVRGTPQAVRNIWALDSPSKFDVRNLVGTLTLIRRQRKKVREATLKNESFGETEPPEGADATLSDVMAIFDDTLTLEETVRQLPSPTSPNTMMKNMVETLTERFPRGKQPPPKKDTEQEIEGLEDSQRWEYMFRLQSYCITVLGQDVFKDVYDILGSTDDHQALERKFRNVLTEEQYNNVSFQLFTCKTLEDSLSITDVV